MSVDYAALQNQQLPTQSWLSSSLSLIKYSPLSHSSQEASATRPSCGHGLHSGRSLCLEHSPT